MNSLEEQLDKVSSVAIAGHIKPDGDCVGSCLAVYNYLKEFHPDFKTDLYLEPIPNLFRFLSRSDEIISTSNNEINSNYDLFIVLDCGDTGRLGPNAVLMDRSKRVICVDHHISNTGFGDDSRIVPDASSTAELVFELLPQERITKQIAECLYVGIVHDTGIFQYSCTSSKTMNIAGFLMDTGIDFPRIVDKTYMEKTYEQHLILAKALLKSERYLDGACIVSVITLQEMEECHVLPKHLEGIVQSLRSTKDVEAAVFLYQTNPEEYKISLRSSSDAVDVAKIAIAYGGGGHIRAAGASTKLSPKECISQIVAMIQEQLEQAS